MQSERAEEIMNSKGVIEVLYNNKPVWIQNVNPVNNIAEIKILDTDERISAPVERLTENKK